MSNARYALCLSLLLATACKSSPPPDEPVDGQVAEGSADGLGANGGQDPDAPDALSVGEQLGADATRSTLAEQREAFLVEQHIEKAGELASQMRLDEAQQEAEAALDLEPDSLRAQELRAEILALKGEPAAATQTIAQEMGEQYRLRIQQLRAEAEDGLRRAKMMIASNNYQGAIAELEIVNNLIRFAPYSINWEGLDTEASTLLENARASRESAAAAAEEAAQRRAYEELQAEEAAVRDRRVAQVSNLLDRSISAFQVGDYEAAEDFAKQVLERDPRNEQAQEIRDAAFRAGRTKVRAEYVERKREQFQRWQESLKELQIPWTEVITLPDSERWNELSEMRSKRRGLDLSQTISEGERTLREQIRTTTVQLPGITEEESLSNVIGVVRTQTGLPLVVDPAAENAVTTNGVVFNFSFENALTVEQALNLIVGMAGEGVTWTIRHDVILLTSTEKARGAPIVVNHDVQDLTRRQYDFVGPRIDRLRLLEEMQDDDGGGPFGNTTEQGKGIEPGDLVTLIQENIAVGTWQDEGIALTEGEGYVLATHTPEVQAQIQQFLEDLRRFGSSLVTIESKFLTVGANWIQEIGVDFRGLESQLLNDVTNGLEDMASQGLDNGGTGTSGQNAAGNPSGGVFYDDGQDGAFTGRTENFFEDPLGNALTTIGGASFQLTFLKDLDLSAILRAVEKSANFDLVNDQVLSVHNTERAFVAVINQRAYIQDFDVEVAQFQAVADPQINVLNEGVVLDVRPTIHHNRKYLTLEIQPTVAKVIALRDFSSTLAGNTSPVSFQLPEIEVQSVFTTAIIPDGGSIMLGGLSNVRNIERRAEVPWFSRIPILGFFFKREGYSDENESLMILIRARITDVREELQRIETR